MKLEELRRAHGMTQTELAILAGVQQNTVSQWESGKRNPSIHFLINLAEIFGCTIDDLYGRGPQEPALAGTGEPTDEWSE